MNTKIGKRLKMLVDARYGGKVKNFTEAVNLPYTTINEYVIGKKDNPKIDLLLQIAKQVDDLNVLWLFFGYGKMFGPANYEEPLNYRKAIDHLAEPAPTYGQKVPFRNSTIDTLHFADVKLNLANYRNYILPEMAKADVLERVNCDDMLPDIRPGDVVGLRIKRKNEDWHYGKTYVLETANGNLIKKVMPESADAIRLVSTNSAYPAIVINKSEIIGAGMVTELLGPR